MAAEYSYSGSQIVQPGASVLFNITPVPCGRGFIFIEMVLAYFDLRREHRLIVEHAAGMFVSMKLSM